MEIKSTRKFGIRLRSKYTGEEITLGMAYGSEGEARKWAEIECCERCNSFSIIELPDNPLWINKERGFVNQEIYSKEKRDEN